jgi:hypothetical protein
VEVDGGAMRGMFGGEKCEKDKVASKPKNIHKQTTTPSSQPTTYVAEKEFIMGAQQSSERDIQSEESVKRCYYEVLGVDRQATEEEYLAPSYS